MKKLAIIIVNYNVKHFLFQMLKSLEIAMCDLDTEVYVIDNNSVDGSCQMVEENFAWVKLIKNKDNVGFAKANNQGIRQSNAEYVLLLNPDTVVEEDTLRKSIDFMDNHPDAGGMGVKIINGEGKFLNESKRSLPTPWVAFYKMFGLAMLFPKSKKFGKYHLTYLDKNKNHEVEVLSGAYMMLRRSVLDKVGLLDEDYFMYGEDIDLCYRILKANYKNYYLSETKIIHYRGESTKKGSLNYVLVFYNAMRIFARKNFSPGKKNIFNLIINLAITIRASVDIAYRIIRKVFHPTIEALLIFLLSFMAYPLAHYSECADFTCFRSILAEVNGSTALLIAAVFVSYFYLFGAYRHPFRIRWIVSSVFLGFITLATLAYLIPDYRMFSQNILIITSALVFIESLLNRSLVNYIKAGTFYLNTFHKKRIAIIGDIKEAERVAKLIRYELYYPSEIAGLILPGDNDHRNINVIGDISQIDEIVRLHDLEEVIFCSKSTATGEIIDLMSKLAGKDVGFKIVPNGAGYIIGPKFILGAGLGSSQHVSLQATESKLKKKIFDFTMSLALLIAFPLTFWIYSSRWTAFTNIWKVLQGNNHLVGYIDGSSLLLPRLKGGILSMKILFKNKTTEKSLTTHEHIKLDEHYAKNYSPRLDWLILVNGIRALGDRKAA